MTFTTPVLQIDPPELRGAEPLPAESFDALSQARREAILSPYMHKVADPIDGENNWITFDQIDQSTHYAIQTTTTGLPTLLPKFYADSVSIKQLQSTSCDNRPSPRELIKTYLEASQKHFGALLPEAAKAIGPLPKSCQISILIPAAAREEAPFIGRTLRAFASQSVDFDTFEIVVFLNCLDSSGQVDERSRKTISAMEEVKRMNPQLNIRPFFAALPEQEVWTIGRIRKLLMDSTLLRSYERSRKRPEHILFTTDADCTGVHPQLIEHTLSQMHKHPEIDSLRGSIDWDWKALASDPLLLFSVRLMSTLDAHRRLTDPTYGVGTPSFAIRAERYADAGGYNALDRVGEDMDLMARLKANRAGSSVYTPIARGGPKTRIWTSLRRAERAMEIDNTPPQNMWFVDGARFQLSDPEVRQEKRPREQSFHDLLEAPDFNGRIEELAAKTFHTYAQPHSTHNPVTARDLAEIIHRYSGVQFTFSEDDTQVRVKNLERLKEYLIHFHENAERYWKTRFQLEW